MKLSIKIILLVCFVVIAIGAVLIFVKTQLEPPRNLAFKDPYAKPLNEDVQKVGSQAFPQCKGDFAKAYHKIRFMNQEQLLNNEQADGLIVKIDTAYGNRIVDYAFRIFNSSNWPDENLNATTAAIASLRNDKLSNGQKAITQEMEGSFRKVDGVINDYRQAWAFARNTGFHSVADAQQRINSVGTYRNKPYISNNTALMAALNNVPANIANAHYNYVSGQVNRLRGYTGMSESSFDNLVDQVNRVIAEYKNTGIYGSNKKSVGPLESTMSQLATKAYEHYAGAGSAPSSSSQGSGGDVWDWD